MVPAGSATPAANEKCTVLGCAAFWFSDVEPACVVQTPDVRIRAVKKPGRRLLPTTGGKLEEDNLFGIRKWNWSCTILSAKTSQKMDILQNSEGSCGRGIVMSRMGVKSEPAKKTAFKFTVRGRPRHGMACMWNQPELNVSWRCGGYQLRMQWSDTLILLAMNQQHRD